MVKNMFYAQINENNICQAVSDLTEKVHDVRLVPIGFMDVELIGKKYENGEWVEVPTTEPPIFETDKKLLQIQATVDYLAMMTE